MSSMSKIHKIKNKDTGETILPVSTFDAIFNSNGNKNLNKVLSEILNSIENVSISYILKTLEDGIHFVDSNGYIMVSIDNKGINAATLNPLFGNIILSYIRENYLDEVLSNLVSSNYGDGENINDLDTSTNTDGLFIEVYDSSLNANKKIDLKIYVQSLMI